MLSYPGIQININQINIEPEKFIEERIMEQFSIQLEKRVITGQIQLIIWKKGKYNKLHLCSKEGVTLWSGPLQVAHENLAIGVYVQSDYIDEINEIGAIDLEDLDMGLREIRSKARDMVRNYYFDWSKKMAAQTIEELRKEDVYPYKGNPVGKLEEAERQVFDICTLTIQKRIPEFAKGPKKQKKLTLSLIKEALRQKPSELKHILQEVLDLSDNQIKDLSDILDKTSLTAIITTTKMVTDRLRFLNGLDQIIFSPDYHKHLKERSQLHKMLLNELWLFGEHYTYGCDDVRLSNVLKEYVSEIGRKELAADISKEELSELSDIPDICLWSQYSMGRPDEVENLIIELKRPLVKIGHKEIDQITTYARKVANNPRFPKEKTKWSFLIVSRDFDDNIKFSMEEKTDGLYTKTGNVAIFVKNWGQVINEALARHKYLQQNLDVAIENNVEGLNYLKEKYSSLLHHVIEQPAVNE